MRLIHVAVAVLCLLSAGQSAPVTSCEKLIQRIEIQGRDQVRHLNLTCRLSHYHVVHFSVIVYSFLQLRETPLSVSAAGQVDVNRRKHKFHRIQTDDEVFGERVGKNHCC